MILSFCSFVIALIVLHVHNLVNICAQVFIRMKTKSTTFICIYLISHYFLSKFSLSSCTKCCKTRNFNLIIVRGLMELFGVGNLLVLHHSYLKGYIIDNTVQVTCYVDQTITILAAYTLGIMPY